MHRVSVVGGCLNPKDGQEFGYPDQQLRHKHCDIGSTTHFIRNKEKSLNASKVSKFLLIKAPDYNINADTIEEKITKSLRGLQLLHYSQSLE